MGNVITPEQVLASGERNNAVIAIKLNIPPSKHIYVRTFRLLQHPLDRPAAAAARHGDVEVVVVRCLWGFGRHFGIVGRVSKSVGSCGFAGWRFLDFGLMGAVKNGRIAEFVRVAWVLVVRGSSERVGVV